MAIYALRDLVPTISKDAYIHPDAVIIGSVRIAEGVSVWPGAVLRGDASEIVVGAGTSIQDGAVLHCAADLPTIIGSESAVGHLAHLEGCSIGDSVLLGVGSVVLHRAVIGRGAMVAANAVVLQGTQVPPFALAVGVPAKIRPDSVVDGAIEAGVAQYRRRVEEYRSSLRRLD
jgi:carbonic anhydrase/acetyltransferase-like protein (isoleucine patch superfamily)